MNFISPSYDLVGNLLRNTYTKQWITLLNLGAGQPIILKMHIAKCFLNHGNKIMSAVQVHNHFDVSLEKFPDVSEDNISQIFHVRKPR